MARFYASFDNSSVPSIEAGTGNNFYQQLTMTNGSTIRSALVAARDALSAAMYAQIENVNKNGLLGIVEPFDSITNNGTTLSSSTLYTNSNFVWQSDPRAVKTSVATVVNATTGNSTPVSPLDPYSIASSLYTDATTAVQNTLNAITAPTGYTGNGPYARIGLNSFRTLASIWSDFPLTYMAWDDYTPGTVQGLSAAWIGQAGAFTVIASWASWQYTNDENPAGKVRVLMSLGSTTGGNNYSFDSGLISPPLTREVQWQSAPTADTYILDIFVRVYDAIIPEHYGEYASIQNQTVVITGSSGSGSGAGSGGPPPLADPFQDPPVGP